MKVLTRQSLFDIAIQEQGDLTKVMDIAVNNGISITDEFTVGDEIAIETLTKNKTATYYQVNALKPATAMSIEDVNQTTGGDGIDFWGIEFDFIIQ